MCPGKLVFLNVFVLLLLPHILFADETGYDITIYHNYHL
jgi:hypothetical protein